MQNLSQDIKKLYEENNILLSEQETNEATHNLCNFVKILLDIHRQEKAS